MYITLETGGSRPPTSNEAAQVRLSLGCASADDLADVLARYNYTNADSPVSISVDGGTIFVDCSGGNVDLFLPPITATMQTFRIKRIDASGNNLTVSPAAADAPGVQIEGNASASIPISASVEVRSNTTHWWITMFSTPNLVLIP